LFVYCLNSANNQQYYKPYNNCSAKKSNFYRTTKFNLLTNFNNSKKKMGEEEP
jgi:hypothetical protein